MVGDVPPVENVSWAYIIKTQGVAWALLFMIALGIGHATKTLVPQAVRTINEGYAENSKDLTKAAQAFADTAAENRKFMSAVIEDFKDERLRDQHLMLELIRRGDITGDVIAEAMESAAEATLHPVRPSSRHLPASPETERGSIQ